MPIVYPLQPNPVDKIDSFFVLVSDDAKLLVGLSMSRASL